jgi:lipid-A-disaccharide synthase
MDTILCASGTATLMVGICRKPMVIMYKMNALTAFFAKKLVRHIPYFGMVNLILNEEAVPERFQEKASKEAMTQLLLDIIHNVDGRRTKILQKLDVLKERLGGGDGIKNLANSIEKFILKR